MPEKQITVVIPVVFLTGTLISWLSPFHAGTTFQHEIIGHAIIGASAAAGGNGARAAAGLLFTLGMRLLHEHKSKSIYFISVSVLIGAVIAATLIGSIVGYRMADDILRNGL